jgi:hypothetical protein
LIGNDVEATYCLLRHIAMRNNRRAPHVQTFTSCFASM